MARARIEVQDGVGVAMLRDTVIVWWIEPSTTPRVLWTFDMAEKAHATSPKGVIVLQVIPPSSAPPDDETRRIALEHASETTPSREELEAAIDELCRVLGLPEGAFPLSATPRAQHRP